MVPRNCNTPLPIDEVVRAVNGLLSTKNSCEFLIAGSYPAAVEAYRRRGLLLPYNDIDVYIVQREEEEPTDEETTLIKHTRREDVFVRDQHVEINIVTLGWRQLDLARLMNGFDINAVMVGFTVNTSSAAGDGQSWSIYRYEKPAFNRFLSTRMLELVDIAALQHPESAFVRLLRKAEQMASLQIRYTLPEEEVLLESLHQRFIGEKTKKKLDNLLPEYKQEFEHRFMLYEMGATVFRVMRRDGRGPGQPRLFYKVDPYAEEMLGRFVGKSSELIKIVPPAAQLRRWSGRGNEAIKVAPYAELLISKVDPYAEELLGSFGTVENSSEPIKVVPHADQLGRWRGTSNEAIKVDPHAELLINQVDPYAEELLGSFGTVEKSSEPIKVVPRADQLDRWSGTSNEAIKVDPHAELLSNQVDPYAEELLGSFVGRSSELTKVDQHAKWLGRWSGRSKEVIKVDLYAELLTSKVDPYAEELLGSFVGKSRELIQVDPYAELLGRWSGTGKDAIKVDPYAELLISKVDPYAEPLVGICEKSSNDLTHVDPYAELF